MRKTIPVVVVGGAVLLIASQFLTINVGLKNPSVPIEEQVAEKAEAAAETVKETAKSVIDAVKDTNEKSSDLDAPENAYVGMVIVDVVIDGDNYLLLTVQPTQANVSGVEEERKQVAQHEVVRLATELPGDPTGIKVRIQRTANATAQAEAELLAALAAAGVSKDQIDYRSKLVED